MRARSALHIEKNDLVHFDTTHFTATFARTLAPELGEQIEALLP